MILTVSRNHGDSLDYLQLDYIIDYLLTVFLTVTLTLLLTIFMD